MSWDDTVCTLTCLSVFCFTLSVWQAIKISPTQINVGALAALVHGQWEETSASQRESWVLCSDMSLPRALRFSVSLSGASGQMQVLTVPLDCSQQPRGQEV